MSIYSERCQEIVPPGVHCWKVHPCEDHNPAQSEEVEEEREEPRPVGRCHKCGAWWYVDVGYCGGCLPNGPLG